MTMRYASGFNAFVPEATGQVIGYIRDPNRYAYNSYTQIVSTPVPVGIFFKLHVDDPQRLASLDEHVWEDGALRPNVNRGDGIRFDQTEFQTIRHNFPFVIGWKALDTAGRSGLKLLLAYSALARNQAQMHRTQRLITLLETAGNWGNNTGAANTLNGGYGFWDLASNDPTSGSYLAIKKTLDQVAINIHLKTNGVVGNFRDASDSGLQLILSPNAAARISQTDEMRDAWKRTEFAKGFVLGKDPQINAKWGLPPMYNGWVITIEDAVRDTARPLASGAESTTGAAGTKNFIKSDSSAVVVSRVGGIDGEYGAPSFSTVQLYYYKREIELKVFDEPKHERTEGHVTIDDKEVLAAPQSGYLITSILSS